MSNKIYTLTYHEVQIAGYRVFNSYNEALKEYLKHCICETKSLLNSPDSSESSSDCGLSDEEKSTESDKEDFDELTCVFEVQELQGNEYVTIKEYDYETFQLVLEDIDNIPDYIEELEKNLENDVISQDLYEIFTD